MRMKFFKKYFLGIKMQKNKLKNTKEESRNYFLIYVKEEQKIIS